MFYFILSQTMQVKTGKKNCTKLIASSISVMWKSNLKQDQDLKYILMLFRFAMF